MYLHLGQDTVVPEASVIGIFDLDKTTGSHITRRFLGNAEKMGRVVNVSDELPKSFIICSDEEDHRDSRRPGPVRGGKAGEGGNMKVYLSQLSPQTLSKRSGATWMQRGQQRPGDERDYSYDG